MYNSDQIGVELKIVGIIRPTGDSNGMDIASTGYIGYTSALTDYLIDKTGASELRKKQAENKEKNIISGLPFLPENYEEPSESEKAERLKAHTETLDAAGKAEIFIYLSSLPTTDDMDQMTDDLLAQYDRDALEDMIVTGYAEQMGIGEGMLRKYLSSMDDETLMGYIREAMGENYKEEFSEQMQEALESMSDDQLAAMLDVTPFTDEQYAMAFDNFIPEHFSELSYDDVLDSFGTSDKNDPTSILIFSKTFAQKDMVAEAISGYNDRASEENKINYTDYVALLMSSITDIISGISYLLIAFVAISLVVSSIMIGIITYISVLERTREIGILRAIGASKRDISRVFNAETLIVGFTSGMIGIIISAVAILPINMILYSLTEIAELKAVLPIRASVILILISMGLTLIAGLIPSGVAAKKDPVEALRTE